MPTLAAASATSSAAAAAPLTVEELAVCRSLGISEAGFRESRSADLERAAAWARIRSQQRWVERATRPTLTERPERPL